MPLVPGVHESAAMGSKDSSFSRPSEGARQQPGPSSGLRPVRPTVSVIIPARDAAATIGFQLEALSRQDYCDWWEIMVAGRSHLRFPVKVQLRRGLALLAVTPS